MNALILGGIFGLLFGILDVEDENEWIRHTRFLEQQLISAPISGVLGFLVAILNFKISQDARIDIIFDPVSNRGEGI